MSIDLYACALDVELLRATIGSKQSALVKRLLEANAERIVEFDQDLGLGSHSDSGLSLADALRQVISGRFDLPRDLSFLHERALVLVARSLGEPLETDAFHECSVELWDRIQADLCACRRAVGVDKDGWPTLRELLRRGPPAGIPLRPAAERETGFLDADEVRRQWLLLQACRRPPSGRPGTLAFNAQNAYESLSPQTLTPTEAGFLFMPLMHAEELALQQRCHEGFRGLTARVEQNDPVRTMLENNVKYAKMHMDVVARFGRFPHRNVILERASTYEEEAFLKEPGSSF